MTDKDKQALFKKLNAAASNLLQFCGLDEDKAQWYENGVMEGFLISLEVQYDKTMRAEFLVYLKEEEGYDTTGLS